MNLAGILTEALEGKRIAFKKGIGEDERDLGDFLVADVSVEGDGALVFRGDNGGYIKLKPCDDLRFVPIVSDPDEEKEKPRRDDASRGPGRPRKDLHR